jgi:integral membrane sensor domain MASE1
MRIVLKVVVGGGLIGIAVGAVVAPKAVAWVFGMPVDEAAALAWVRAAGMRDGVLGAIVVTSPDARALRRALGWASLVGLSDAVLLAATRGPRWQHALHLGGCAAVALLAAAMTSSDE